MLSFSGIGGLIKIMDVFFFIAHEKGFKFHAHPQTGTYSCFYRICCSTLKFYFWLVLGMGGRMYSLCRPSLLLYLSILRTHWELLTP